MSLATKSCVALSLAAVASLAACSGGEDTIEADGDTAIAAPAGDELPADTDVEATDAAPPVVDTEPVEPPAPAIAPCPDQAGLACSGALIAEVENLSVTPARNRNSYVARMTLKLTNRSGDAVRIAMPGDDISINFDNGAGLAQDAWRNGVISGIQLCRDDVTECFQQRPNDFKTLQPGDSPARINIEVRDEVEGALLASMPSIATGTTTINLFIVDINGNGRREQIAVPNAPVTNQTGG